MGGLLVVFSLLVAVTTYADDLQVLKAAAKSYVDAMKAAVLALPDELDCSETITKANEYAVAKVAYYNAARQAMPALLEIARTRD